MKIYNGREGLAQHPDIAGDVKFRTEAAFGLGKPVSPETNIASAFDAFADPRPDKLGPLPSRTGPSTRAFTSTAIA